MNAKTIKPIAALALTAAPISMPVPETATSSATHE